MDMMQNEEVELIGSDNTPLLKEQINRLSNENKKKEEDDANEPVNIRVDSPNAKQLEQA